MAKTKRIKSQDKIVLAFLERVVERIKKQTGMKGWKYFIDDEDPINENDNGVYGIANESFDSPYIVEINVERNPKRLNAFIYNNSFNSVLESLKAELPRVAKKLKIKANNYKLLY